MREDFGIDRDAAERALEADRGEALPEFWRIFEQSFLESEGLGMGIEAIFRRVYESKPGPLGAICEAAVKRSIFVALVATWLVRGGSLPKLSVKALGAYLAVVQAPESREIYEMRVEDGWRRWGDATVNAGIDISEEMRDVLVTTLRESSSGLEAEQLERLVRDGSELLSHFVGLALHLLFHALDQDPGENPTSDLDAD